MTEQVLSKIPIEYSADRYSIPLILIGLYIIVATFSYSLTTTIGVISMLSGLILYYINNTMVNTFRSFA
jgi:hypothetical protein